jgi:hypothetical protein
MGSSSPKVEFISPKPLNRLLRFEENSPTGTKQRVCRCTLAKLLIGTAIITQLIFVSIALRGSGRFTSHVSRAFRPGAAFAHTLQEAHDVATHRNSSTGDAGTAERPRLLASALKSLSEPVTVLIPHLASSNRSVNVSAWESAHFRPLVYTVSGTSMHVGSMSVARFLVNVSDGLTTSKQQQQLVDFATMLQHYADGSECRASGMFMLADDDVEPCENAQQYIHAAILHAGTDFMKGTVKAIRFSVGSNGLLMKCTDIPDFLSFVREHVLLQSDLYAVDDLWDRWGGAAMLVFKFNLLQHDAGHASTIWSEKETSRRDSTLPQCMEPIFWSGRSFDPLLCKSHWFTPCGAGDATAIETAVQDDMDYPTAELLVDRLGIELTDFDMSCAKHCRLRGEMCDEGPLRSINHCNILRVLHPTCSYCHLTTGKETPCAVYFIGENSTIYSKCFVQALPRMISCTARWMYSLRACVCREKYYGEEDLIDEGDPPPPSPSPAPAAAKPLQPEDLTGDFAWLGPYLASLNDIEESLKELNDASASSPVPHVEEVSIDAPAPALAAAPAAAPVAAPVAARAPVVAPAVDARARAPASNGMSIIDQIVQDAVMDHKAITAAIDDAETVRHAVQHGDAHIESILAKHGTDGGDKDGTDDSDVNAAFDKAIAEMDAIIQQAESNAKAWRAANEAADQPEDDTRNAESPKQAPEARREKQAAEAVDLEPPQPADARAPRSEKVGVSSKKRAP